VRAYDAAGNRLTLTIEGDVVRIAPSGESSPNELAEWLRSSRLLQKHDAGWLRGAALPELVAAFDTDENLLREQRPFARFALWLRLRRKAPVKTDHKGG